MPPLVILLFLLLATGAVAQSPTGTADQQLKALLDIKSALGASASATNGFATWTVSTPPCQFSGITCSPAPSDSAVTGIDITGHGVSGSPFPFLSICTRLPSLQKLVLSKNALSGPVTADLRLCTALQHLDLSSNSFSGPIPDLSPLKNLRVLNLSANSFTGPLPAYFLGNFTQLTDLQLGDNPFDPSPFPSQILTLTNLTWLYLSNCSLTGEIPRGIGTMTKLINLEVATNSMSGEIPPEIGNLKNLYQLELYENSFTGELPSTLSNLVNLAYFDASTNSLRGNISAVRTLTNLVSLQLLENDFSGEVPQEIGEFKRLVNLSLYANRLSGPLPAQLGSWAEFDFIDVSTNNLTGPIPPHMCRKGTMTRLLMLENQFEGGIPEEYGNCSTLQRFRVSDNKLSGEVPAGLWALPNLNIIDLSNNNFTGTISPGIGRAKGLAQLSVNDNQFSGSIPSEISGAVNLVKIEAWNNRLTGGIPESIGELKLLNNLLLQNNDLSGEIPASLGSCSSLNEINLAGNTISGDIPATICGLEVLNSLNLSNNLLTGGIPSEMSALRLSSLDLSRNRLTGPVPAAFSIDAFNQSFTNNLNLCITGPRVRFLSPCPSGPGSSSDRSRVVLSCILAATAVLLACLGLYLFMKKRRAMRDEKASRSGSGVFSKHDSWDFKSFGVLVLDEQEILNGVTPENMIGKGGSGNVYRVELKCGKTVAVKHIWNTNTDTNNYSSNLGAGDASHRSKHRQLSRRGSVLASQFESEVGTLSSIRHVNVVKLHCSITGEESSLLVYEYLPNGSLWDRLHGSAAVKAPLDWDSRYDIALGAAKGLEYLHHGSGDRPILHRDVKSSNILLDDELKPRIADFGLAKILQAAGRDESTAVIAGTHGYMAPEYAYTYKVNEKSDVYSFGVVLLELVTGRRPVEPEPESGKDVDLVRWVYSRMTSEGHDGRDVLSLIDPSAAIQHGEMEEEEAVRVLRVAVMCTVKLPSLRPSMRAVVQMLEDAGRWRVLAAMAEEDDDGRVDDAVEFKRYGSSKSRKVVVVTKEEGLGGAGAKGKGSP